MTFIHTCTFDTNVYIGISSRMIKKSVFCLVHVLYCVTYRNISILAKIIKDAQVLGLLSTCKTGPNILPDLVEYLVVFCMLKANTGLMHVFAFCQISIYSNIKHKTAHVQDRIRSSSYTLESEVHVCIKVFYRIAFIKAREAQLGEHEATHLKVMGSSPTVSKIFFSFCILPLSTRSWQVDWSHTNEIKHK